MCKICKKYTFKKASEVSWKAFMENICGKDLYRIIYDWTQFNSGDSVEELIELTSSLLKDVKINQSLVSDVLDRILISRDNKFCLCYGGFLPEFLSLSEDDTIILVDKTNSIGLKAVVIKSSSKNLGAPPFPLIYLIKE